MRGHHLRASNSTQLDMVRHAHAVRVDMLTHFATCMDCTEETCPVADELYAQIKTTRRQLSRVGIDLQVVAQ
jgi:metal-sulfur cluster biosynthetic enzyme